MEDGTQNIENKYFERGGYIGEIIDSKLIYFKAQSISKLKSNLILFFDWALVNVTLPV